MPFLFMLPLVGAVALVAIVAHAGRGSREPVRARPAATHRFELDRGMREDLVHEVLVALVEESDGSKLEALAASLAPTYPLAASELRARAATLASARPTRSGAVPDRSEAAVTLQAALRAYAQETDPVLLQGFASSLRERYPSASILLAAKAQQLTEGSGEVRT